MSNPVDQPKQLEIDLDAYLQVLTGQRNQALDTVAQQQGLISRLQKRITELTDEVWKLQHPAKPNGDAREEVRAT